jgi:hypothetical protein
MATQMSQAAYYQGYGATRLGSVGNAVFVSAGSGFPTLGRHQNGISTVAAAAAATVTEVAL